VDERLGGKGVNVAGVLAQLDVPVVATGLLRDGPESFTPIAAAPRRTVVVTDGTDATGFWEPGPTVTPAEWTAFTADFDCLIREAKVVVFSGSLPSGLPDHAYAFLNNKALAAGCLTILDTSGAALRQGVLSGPTLVKPNVSELSELGPQVRPSTTVVASHGAAGLTGGGWRAKPPVLQGNPTGAGDACVAALARGLLRGTPWPELLRDAAALSAAAVVAPIAGQVDLAVYESLLPQVIVEEI
jgi:tagatose 6-phosphate kinase